MQCNATHLGERCTKLCRQMRNELGLSKDGFHFLRFKKCWISFKLSISLSFSSLKEQGLE